MILLEDVLLPEPYDTPVHLCLTSYRAARKAALKAIRHINTELVAVADKQIDEHEAKYPNRDMPLLQQQEMMRRIHFIGETTRHYRQRLVFVRSYWRYAQAIHGPA